MRPILAVMVKEFIHVLRDRRMLPSMFIAPILQLVIFGYAANTDVHHILLLLVDHDHSPESARLVDSFLATGYFDLVGAEDDVDRVEPWFLNGRAQMALVIGPRYGRDAATGRAPAVQLLVDGSDASTAGTGLSYATGVILQKSAELLGDPAAAAGPITRVGNLGQIELRPRVLYNPDLRARWFYVPAVLAMVMMMITMLLSSMAVVREKELGTMEQIIVTPIRPWQLIVGKLTPFLAIGLVDMVLVTLVAVFFFRVPLRGSFPTLVGASLLFMFCALGLGLLMSTVARNQQQAMIGSVFMLMVPMVYLSGLIFPIENMPRPIQIATYVIPLRYFATMLRGIFLKGSGVRELWPEAAALAGLGLVVLTISSARFRKRLD